MTSFSGYILSSTVLGVLLLASVILTVMRFRLRPEVRTSAQFFAIVGFTILFQCLHFLEELRSHFFLRFPETFGLEPISDTAFVYFNVAWLAVWIVAAFAARTGLVIAVCPLWFLGLAMVLNFFAHPILALRAGGYFPGLLTAPVVGACGFLLIRELIRATATRTAAQQQEYTD